MRTLPAFALLALTIVDACTAARGAPRPSPADRAAGSGAGSAPRPTPVLAAPLAARRDSFTVVAAGRTLGFQVTALAQVDGGFRYTDTTRVGGFLQATEVLLAPDGSARRMRQVGGPPGAALTSELTYAAGRVRGRVMVAGPDGVRTLDVDTSVAQGVIDDNAVQAVLPSLAWAPGARFTLPVFVGGKNASAVWTLRVLAREPVTVPAGTFDAYRVALEGAPTAVTFYIEAGPAHRCLKIVPAGSPVEMVRAR